MGEDGLLHCGKCHKPKEAYFLKARLCLVVTGTRLNATAAGQSVKSWKRGMRTKSTMPKWSV